MTEEKYNDDQPKAPSPFVAVGALALLLVGGVVAFFALGGKVPAGPAHGEPGHVHGPGCAHDHGEVGHVHDENCDHDHGEAGHVHDENCDHDHEAEVANPLKKPASKLFIPFNPNVYASFKRR
ncbi:MAG: hypothetical protein IIW01_07775 [Thermoguttaceae bacterium]|nr:hypothetical protein [Thermoguttaceae bacterium]